MTTVIQDRWDESIAEDIRTTDLNKCAYAYNFDVDPETFRLNPFADSIADTSSVPMSESKISDVGICQISGTEYIVGVGYDASPTVSATFYIKSDPISTFSRQASASGNSFVTGSLCTYKLRAFAVDDNGSGQYRLIRFDGAATVTTIGTITATSNNRALLFVHPEDNILYVIISNVISKWDGTTFTSVTSILPLNFTTASITNYGAYLAIAMNPVSSSDNAVCYLWGRDTTINTLQGTIDLGKGHVGIVENLYNNLYFIMSNASSFFTTTQTKLLIKGYAGGSAETIFSLNGIGAGTYKAKRNNRVYFGTGNSDIIYSFGKNKAGAYTVIGSRYIINGAQITTVPSTQSITGISIIGDTIWVGAISQIGVYTLQRSKINSLGESFTYTATSVWRTTVNVNMPIGDRYKQKKLMSARLAVTGKNSGTAVLKYSIDGSAFTSIISETTTAAELVYEATNEADGDELLSGREITFQIETTGGVQPKELAYVYEVEDSLL